MRIQLEIWRWHHVLQDPTAHRKWETAEQGIDIFSSITCVTITDCVLLQPSITINIQSMTLCTPLLFTAEKCHSHMNLYITIIDNHKYPHIYEDLMCKSHDYMSKSYKYIPERSILSFRERERFTREYNESLSITGPTFTNMVQSMLVKAAPGRLNDHTT